MFLKKNQSKKGFKIKFVITIKDHELVKLPRPEVNSHKDVVDLMEGGLVPN
jgi:hypothetical protein